MENKSKIIKKLNKVLIVDDDSDILTIMKLCIERDPSLEVQCAASGEEAIKIAPIFKPDLILLDVLTRWASFF